MNDRFAVIVAVLWMMMYLASCGGSPRYETSRESEVTPDTAATPSDSDTERTPSYTDIPESPEDLVAVPDSCVSTQDIQYRDGFTYLRGRMFTGIACSYYEDGGLHTVTHYENGRRSGKWSVYYPNGVVEKAGTTRSGVEDGLYVENYMNGRQRYEYHYAMGSRTGVWRSWYPDGTRYTERNFRNGMLDGKVLVWDENGKLAKEYDYVHGRLVNSIMHFKGE